MENLCFADRLEILADYRKVDLRKENPRLIFSELRKRGIQFPQNKSLISFAEQLNIAVYEFRYLLRCDDFITELKRLIKEAE